MKHQRNQQNQALKNAAGNATTTPHSAKQIM